MTQGLCRAIIERVLDPRIRKEGLPGMSKQIREQLARHRSELVIGGIRFLTYFCLFMLFFGLMSIHNWPLRHYSRTLATTLLTWFAMTAAMHYIYGGLDLGRRKSRPVISSMILSTFVTDALTYLQLQIMNVNADNNTRLILFGPDFPYLILCFILQVIVLILLVKLGNHEYFRMNPPRKTLVIVGTEREKAALYRKIGRYRLQWAIRDSALSSDENLREKIGRAEAVFLSGLSDADQMYILRLCYDLKKEVVCRAQLEDILISNARQIIVDDAPFLQFEYWHMTIYQRVIKRLMDIVISSFILLLLSPLMAVIALCIRLEDHGPVLFRQKRLTIGGREFLICKFRTMRVEDSGRAHQVSAREEDDRITRTGRWLRKTRLDELPQLWNILKGDMSLVGPRPEMLDNIRQYKAQLPAFVYREKMKAGLTGYAQIEGKYNTTPEDKLMLDLMYIESFSIWLDIKLLFRTFTVFFKPDSTEGFTAAPEEGRQPEQNNDGGC